MNDLWETETHCVIAGRGRSSVAVHEVAYFSELALAEIPTDDASFQRWPEAG